MASMPDNLVELRERAAKALRWTLRDDIWEDDTGNIQYGSRLDDWNFSTDGCEIPVWYPDIDANQAALLLAEVERQNKRKEFVTALLKSIESIVLGDDDWGKIYWLLANATPQQKTKAAVAALTDHPAREEE